MELALAMHPGLLDMQVEAAAQPFICAALTVTRSRMGSSTALSQAASGSSGDCPAPFAGWCIDFAGALAGWVAMLMICLL